MSPCRDISSFVDIGWGAVWSLYNSADLANSSKIKQLRYIETFYEFSDQLKGVGSLDDTISTINIEILGEMLEAYFIAIQNQSHVNKSSQSKWYTAFQFIRDIVLRLSKSDLPLKKIQSIETKLNKLNLLYQQLRISKPRGGKRNQGGVLKNLIYRPLLESTHQ